MTTQPDVFWGDIWAECTFTAHAVADIKDINTCWDDKFTLHTENKNVKALLTQSPFEANSFK